METVDNKARDEFEVIQKEAEEMKAEAENTVSEVTEAAAEEVTEAAEEAEVIEAAAEEVSEELAEEAVPEVAAEVAEEAPAEEAEVIEAAAEEVIEEPVEEAVPKEIAEVTEEAPVEEAEAIEEPAEEPAPEEAAEVTKEAPAEEAVEAVAEEAVEETAEEIAEAAEEVPAEETAEITEEAPVEEAEIIETAAEEVIEEAVPEEVTEAAEEVPAEETEPVETVPEEVIEAAAAEEVLAETEDDAELIAENEAEIPAEEPAEVKTAVTEEQPAKKKGKGAGKKILIAALLLAVVIGLAVGIPAYQKSQKYKLGLELLSNGSYQEAADTFAELEGYQEADQYGAYARGLKAFYDGNLSVARSEFEESGGLDLAGSYTSYINGVEVISQGYDADSYSAASKAFTDAGDLLDSAAMATYTKAVSDFLYDDTAAADTGFRRVISENTLPSEYIDVAENAVLYLDTVAKFDSGDYTVKDDFRTVSSNDDGLIGSAPEEYVAYIEGKEFYDDKHFYKASQKFDDCFGIKDASDLYNSCIQERPSTGIIYNKNNSSAVSIVIEDTSDGEDLFIKIYDSGDKLVESLYIRDGKKGTAKIKAGKHRMALASGDGNEWYGTKDMFGSWGSYARLQIDGDSEYYNFLNNYEYTLKFNVQNGNVSSHYTDYDSF